MAVAVATHTEAAAPTLTSLAREAVMETSDLQAAASALLRRVQGNQAFIRALMREGALRLVRGQRSGLRSAMGHHYLGAREKGLRSHAAAMKGRATLFDWKLPVTGKPIGEATVADLADAADWHAGRAEFEQERSRMYRAVQQRLARSNAMTVREGVPANELAEIMMNAEPDEDDSPDEDGGSDE